MIAVRGSRGVAPCPHCGVALLHYAPISGVEAACVVGRPGGFAAALYAAGLAPLVALDPRGVTGRAFSELDRLVLAVDEDGSATHGFDVVWARAGAFDVINGIFAVGATPAERAEEERALRYAVRHFEEARVVCALGGRGALRAWLAARTRGR